MFFQNSWNSPARGDLPDTGIKPVSIAFPKLASRFFTTTSCGKPGGLSIDPLCLAPKAYCQAEWLTGANMSYSHAHSSLHKK